MKQSLKIFTNFEGLQAEMVVIDREAAEGTGFARRPQISEI